MTDFRELKGFQDGFAPSAPRRAKKDQPVLAARKSGRGRNASVSDKARLARVVSKAPEVMVKITGRTKDAGHLRAHLEYISRNGEIAVETRDGLYVAGREGVHDLADEWKRDVASDPRHRANSNYSVNIILSMPPGTDPVLLKDAVRDFARDKFSERFDYVFAYHDDTRHPHVHLTVRATGDQGERLNPRKADLEDWRQTFAQKLRDRGVAAEATPRRARGVTRKAEKTPVRKLKERGVKSTVHHSARLDAGPAAFGRDNRLRAWEEQSLKRQNAIRRAYMEDAKDLATSPEAADKALGRALAEFVKSMPAPESQRLALARELRAEFERQAARSVSSPERAGPDPEAPATPPKERGR